MTFFSIFSRATIVHMIDFGCGVSLRPTSFYLLFVCFSFFFGGGGGKWLVPFSIRVNASDIHDERPRKGGRCDCERGRRILGSPDREPWEWQFEFVPFSKRVPVTDREEHCLKLVTGGEDVSPPRFFSSQWPKAGLKNREALSMFTRKLPADIFMFHTHYDLFYVPSFFFTVLVLDVTWL